MKAIVFGGSGFIGSHVADVLSDRGYEVKIFDLKRSLYLKPGQEMIIGDILDLKKVTEVIKGCDYVYNFAGIADLDDMTTRPLETVEQNVKGAIILLEAICNANIKRFIFASTIYVHSNKGGFYRCSKQAAEIYIENYNKKYGIPFTILRYGTLYGPRANIRNSIYRYIYQALKERCISRCGTGEEVREYINVKDAAQLSVDILDKKYKNQHVIITGHDSIKFKELLETIREMLDDKVEIKLDSTENQDHYRITPCSFAPKIGNKLTLNYYTAMDQGLLEVMNEIFDTLKKEEIKIDA